ncbi:MAG: ThuA domain-containing protein [Verrucomicrobiales bacterium]|nr:ThuA domain-containing protein [Verrucomicrobiales bacterium]
MINFILRTLSVLFLLAGSLTASPLTFEGTEGPGVGKHIVFIANDHEYRSEEVCPAIAKILAKHYGFKCTVLFGINEEGFIQAGDVPIPHLEVLEDADLLFFVARFMNLPDEQAEKIVDYFERGGPVVGLRTSTHSFNGQKGKWEKLNYNYSGEDYDGGLGKQIFGNTWDKELGQSHYGSNHQMGGTVSGVSSAKDHPIMAGVGSIHAYSGAYKSQPPSDATPLLEVQVLNTFEPSDEINPERPIVNAGWSRDSYVAPSGEQKDARVVYTSFGTSEDLLDEDARRFVVNASFWSLGMEGSIKPDQNVSFVGEFAPSPYSSNAFYRIGVKPQDLAGWDSRVMPAGAKFAGLEDASKLKNSRITRVLQNRPWTLEEIKAMYPDFEFKVKE